MPTSDSPKISIVTVNYNGSAWLEKTILSVLGQNYPNLEYIIIDGGSTDGSVEIIKKYESKLAYWISEPDKGMYDALQKGFDRSTGSIMGWINSDDIYHPRALLNVQRIFAKFPQIKWLTGVPTLVDESDNVTIPPFPYHSIWSRLRYYSFDYKWIQQESTLWTRDLWEQAGGRLSPDLKYAADLELWLRFFRTEKLYNVPFIVGGFRVRSAGQLSIEFKDKYIEEVHRAIRKEWLRISPLNIFLVVLNAADILFNGIPFFNRIYLKSGMRRMLGYPKQVRFNPKTQDFDLF